MLDENAFFLVGLLDRLAVQAIREYYAKYGTRGDNVMARLRLNYTIPRSVLMTELVFVFQMGGDLLLFSLHAASKWFIPVNCQTGRALNRLIFTKNQCVCVLLRSADVMHWLVRLYQHVDIKRCLTRVLYVNIQSLNCRKAISRIKPNKIPICFDIFNKPDPFACKSYENIDANEKPKIRQKRISNSTH